MPERTRGSKSSKVKGSTPNPRRVRDLPVGAEVTTRPECRSYSSAFSPSGTSRDPTVPKTNSVLVLAGREKLHSFCCPTKKVVTRRARPKQLTRLDEA
jgi:hypothetical protein